jgi:hypothetical protein
MLGRAQNGERLTITKLVVGSGAASVPSDLWPRTALFTFEMDVTISSKNDFGDGTLLVEGSFRSDQAPHAFYLKELGVMAHIGAEADRLYSVANVFSDPADYIDPAAPTMQVFKLKLIIDRIPTEELVVEIGPSENVIGENLGADTVGPGIYKTAAGNVLKFKRIVEGANMEIRDEPGGDAIYIGTSVLKTNVDLYVPLTYPGITDPNVLFPTIQAAHDYLLQFTIPPDKHATIHVAAGLFQGVGNSPCYLTHPNASQLTLIGQPRVDKTIVAGPNYVDATHKNVQISGSIADLFVGQPVYLMNTDTGWAGGCYITAKAGAIVTLSVIKRDSRATYNINNSGALGACRLSYFPTIIYEANPNPGNPWTAATVNVVCGNNMTVANLCIIGGYHVLSVPGTRSAISNVFCLGTGGDGATGIGAGDNCVIGWQSDVVVTDCGFGLTGFFTGHNLNVNIIANACDCGIGADGVFGAVPGIASPSGKIYLVHNATCARNWGSSASFGNVFFACNNFGFDAANLGCFIFGPFANYPQLNGTDLYAHNMGFITYSRAGGPEPSCNPAKNTYGQNQNSFIAVY